MKFARVIFVDSEKEYHICTRDKVDRGYYKIVLAELHAFTGRK